MLFAPSSIFLRKGFSVGLKTPSNVYSLVSLRITCRPYLPLLLYVIYGIGQYCSKCRRKGFRSRVFRGMICICSSFPRPVSSESRWVRYKRYRFGAQDKVLTTEENISPLPLFYKVRGIRTFMFLTCKVI